MQWLGLELAWWFNVGVQIFLCISGFLYGQKNLGETTAFYYRRFKKILIPYYMVFIPYGLLQLVFAKNVFKPKSFIKGLIVNDLLTGAGHLWFVATILLCYVLTPLLAAYRDRFVTNRRSLLLFAFFSLTISTLFFGLFNSFYNPAWICCYIMGYALGINEKYEFVGQKKLLLVYGIVAIVGNCIQIYCLYIENIRFKGWQYFSNYNHVFLGVFLFILMRVIFEKKQFGSNERTIIFH